MGAALPRIPVDNYAEKGADGWALKRGNVARRPAHMSAGMGVPLGDDFGIITDLFRRTPDGPVLVDVQRDASASCGRATWPASETRRSDAKVMGWAEALGFEPDGT
jgi:hypothetical protein